MGRDLGLPAWIHDEVALTLTLTLTLTMTLTLTRTRTRTLTRRLGEFGHRLVQEDEDHLQHGAQDARRRAELRDHGEVLGLDGAQGAAHQALCARQAPSLVFLLLLPAEQLAQPHLATQVRPSSGIRRHCVWVWAC